MISFAGIKLKNPILIASGPLTTSLDLLKKAEDNGAAGASLKLTLGQAPFPVKLRSSSLPGKGLFFCGDRRLDRDEGLELMRRGKEETSLVLMANITHPSSDLEGWVSLAKDFEQAGADIIEANLTHRHIGSPTDLLGEKVWAELRGGAPMGQIPELCRLITRKLKGALHIPVVPKPFSNHPHYLETVKAIEEGGADGISISSVLSNCLPAPNIHLNGKPTIALLERTSIGITTGNPFFKYAGFGKISQVRKNTALQVLSSGGISKWEDIVETIMWGASAVALCTHLMWYGFEAIPTMLEGLGRYLAEQGIESLETVQGMALPYLTTAEEVKVIGGAAKVDSDRCNGCGACLKAGHCVAITLENQKACVEPRVCIGCSVCINLCPKKAIGMEAF